MPFLSCSISVFILSIFSSCYYLTLAQQFYVGSKRDCLNTNNSTSELGYTCNGVKRSCQAFLTFRAKPPYDTVYAISNLLASDPTRLSRANSVPETFTFERNKLVIVPVNCSCSGEYYQTNTSYIIKPWDNFYVIANYTFQGLSTCEALRKQNNNRNTKHLYRGQRLVIPLRCACPTKNQSDHFGVHYLMSYVVAEGNLVATIAARFGSDLGWTLEANGLPEEKPTIYPFRTLLVPLKDAPLSYQANEPPPPPSPAPPPSSPSTYSSNQTLNWFYILVGCVGGGAFVLVLCTIIFCSIFRQIEKKIDLIIVEERSTARGKSLEKNTDKEYQELLKSLTKVTHQHLKIYTFEEIQLATNNFSPSCWIKGFVYRGTLNGDLAAIKEMDGDVSKEIDLLQKINHSNVIGVFGVCFHKKDRYLVYEHAANGPLSDWIFFASTGVKRLTWTQKIQIALDVATGLQYLHSFTTPPCVHMDIKSSNILLDSNLRAKIANFGLAKLAQAPEGRFSSTKWIVGTVSYKSPEYLESRLVSTKLDVYAFGVLLLEMLTGKEVTLLYEALNAVLNKEGEESLRLFMESSMQERHPFELVKSVFDIVESCLKRNPEARPAMDEIVLSLSRTLRNSFDLGVAEQRQRTSKFK
ncbi:LysM receptor kinase [Parasponia andersonii]|uniref:LysM receptor kinase n=1 Tax=Parasponia andersonii TaxID=3476 RepID=A0A2P5ALL7_PARAD|nr:LysM receptor kinase [Parasponia andersonii]